MDIEFNDRFMHIRLFGKADGFALHTFEMGAKVEVFTFDALRAVFADVMSFGRKRFFVAFPVVGIEVPHLTGCQLAAQLSTTRIRTASQDKSRNKAGMAVETIPKPHLLLFVLHKAPLLIHFQSQNAWWHMWFRGLRCGLTQHPQNRGGADVQHASNIADARTIERHRHNLAAL